MSQSIVDIARSYQPYMQALRQRLHAQPELSFQEQSTSLMVQAELAKMQIPFELVGDFGVVATIEGGNKDCMVALRADMDALPITEQNTHLPYCSKNAGVMHACGHDGHVAMLLGAAQVFLQIKSGLNGTVKLCFQQAEERGGGTADILNLKNAVIQRPPALAEGTARRFDV
jgi:amidohydrolase